MKLEEDEFTPENTPVAGYSLPPPVVDAARRARASGRPSTRRIWHARSTPESEDPFADLSALRKVDGYEILGQLDSQPNAFVQIARTRTSDDKIRTVKIRRLSKEGLSDPGIRRAAYAEMECASMLQHRHLERSVEVCKIDQQLAFVTEWDNGISLAEMTEEASPAAPASWEVMLAIWEQALAGLQHAHNLSRPELKQLRKELPWLRSVEGVIHGALTPADIQVSERGEVRVTGVGLFYLRERNALADPSVRAFLAPEVRDGIPARASADIYGAAACMLETLRPGALRTDDLASFVETLPGIPLQLKALLHRALAYDPVQRFAGMREFATAVRSVPRQQEVTMARIAELVASYSNAERKRSRLRRGDPTEPGVQQSDRPRPKEAVGSYATQKKNLSERRDPTLSFGAPSKGAPAPPPEAEIDDHSDDLQELPVENLIASLAPRNRSRSWMFILGAVALGGVVAFFLLRDPSSSTSELEGGAQGGDAFSDTEFVVPVIPDKEPEIALLPDASVEAFDASPEAQRDASVSAADATVPTTPPRTAEPPRPASKPATTSTRAKTPLGAKTSKGPSQAKKAGSKSDDGSSRPRMDNPGF